MIIENRDLLEGRRAAVSENHFSENPIITESTVFVNDARIFRSPNSL